MYVVRRPGHRLRPGLRRALVTVVVAAVAGLVFGLLSDRTGSETAGRPTGSAPADEPVPATTSTPQPRPRSPAQTPARSPARSPAQSATPLSEVTGAGALVPQLRDAFADADAAAKKAGVTLTITSGYRTPQLQQKLYRQAVAKYGSPEIARRWVLPPAESAHVKGEAIDVRPQQAARWLQENGARYGLCRRYANEWWHFEVLTERGGTCPALEPYAGG